MVMVANPERRINTRGYVEIFQPSHPAQHDGWVLEHRWIIEQSIGKYLTSDLSVHHINEIKVDNRLDNLYLCTQEEHIRIHNRNTKMTNEKKRSLSRAARAGQKKK